jgi:cytochrome c oxidase subunit 2
MKRIIKSNNNKWREGKMIDSSNVLNLMKVVYVIYVAIVISMVGMYTIGLTRETKIIPKIKIPFYGWIGLLVFVGVGIHIMTYIMIPWVKWDLNRDKIKADKEFNISIADYKFTLPEKTLVIEEGQTVRFNLESKDYTYGFGLFRENGSIVFQMQVVPGSTNNLVWKFDKPGKYSIRSTEYSGPKGGNILIKNAVAVASGPALAQLILENKMQNKTN